MVLIHNICSKLTREGTKAWWQFMGVDANHHVMASSHPIWEGQRLCTQGFLRNCIHKFQRSWEQGINTGGS
jgi:hypothetical protein